MAELELSSENIFRCILAYGEKIGWFLPEFHIIAGIRNNDALKCVPNL